MTTTGKFTIFAPLYKKYLDKGDLISSFVLFLSKSEKYVIENVPYMVAKRDLTNPQTSIPVSINF